MGGRYMEVSFIYGQPDRLACYSGVSQLLGGNVHDESCLVSGRGNECTKLLIQMNNPTQVSPSNSLCAIFGK